MSLLQVLQIGTKWLMVDIVVIGSYGVCGCAHTHTRPPARTHTHDDVKHEVQTWLRGQDPTFYRQGFEKWISRIDKCINREGVYVERY
jgi:hypothetical protein